MRDTKTKIEDRLAWLKEDRIAAFEKWYPQFVNHRLFCDPASKVRRYAGSWARRNERALRVFMESTPEHDLAGLIRETLLDSKKGKNAGWPDLVVWNDEELLFAEVKWKDAVSTSQLKWIEEHEERYTVEILRVTA